MTPEEQMALPSSKRLIMVIATGWYCCSGRQSHYPKTQITNVPLKPTKPWNKPMIGLGETYIQ